MPEFVRHLQLAQFVVPTVGAGLLFAGMLFYGYLALKYHSKLYISMAMVALFGMCFVGSETMILGFGGFLHDWHTSVRFHQAEHLSGAMYLFCLPFFIGNILEFGPRWKRINMMIAYAGLAYAAVCFIAVLAQTDLFISASVRKATWVLYEEDFGRGKEGILYMGRDILLLFLVVYSFVCIVVDLRRTRRFSYLMYPIIGIVFAVACAAVDVVFVYTAVIYDPFPDTYFSRFSLGITIFTFSLLSGLTHHFVDAAKEIDRAHKKAIASEGKYRVLVEGTNDLVFTLDEKLCFLSVNKAVLREFGMPEKKLLEKTLYEFVSSGEGELGRSVIGEKIRSLRSKGLPVTFKAELRGVPGLEAKEYLVRLEYVVLDDGRKEILGRAAADQESQLVRFITSESQNYVIGNHLSTADELSKRLVACAEPFLDARHALNLRVGLREVLVNAIEHGNLGITFSEKSEATMAGDYLSYIAARQNDPSRSEKKVTVEYRFDGDSVSYMVTDDGEGFDTAAILERAGTAEPDNLPHGRGILIAMGVFDSVSYNEKGNSVTLTKRFGGGKS